MSLATLLQPKFNVGDRNRGTVYFKQGFVEIQHSSNKELTANVYGSSVYNVSITNGGTKSQVSYHCDCPRFRDGYCCKHLWATISQSGSNVCNRYCRTKQVKPKPWMQLIQDATPTAEKNRSVPALDWRPDKNTLHKKQHQIWSVIDASKNINSPSLFLTFFYQETRKDGEWGGMKPLLNCRSISPTFDKQVDQDAWGILRDSLLPEPAYNYGYYVDSTHELNAGEVTAIMPVLAKTGRLVWSLNADYDSETQFEECKQVAWDADEPFVIANRIQDKERSSQLIIELQRNHERVDAANVIFAMDGYALLEDRIVRCANPQSCGWITAAQQHGAVTIYKKIAPRSSKRTAVTHMRHRSHCRANGGSTIKQM